MRKDQFAMRSGRAGVRSCPIPASSPKSSNTCDFIASRSRLPFSGYTFTPSVAQIRAFKASSITYPQRYAQPSYRPVSNNTSASCSRRRASSRNCCLVAMASTRQKIHHRIRTVQRIIQISLRVVDLGALELIGVVDVQRLPLGVEVDGGDGGFAVAVAGFLGAAERQDSIGADGRCIH